MNRFSGISSLLISLALLTACTSNPRVQSDFDDSVDFSQYKTFNFGSQTEILNPDVLFDVSVDVEDKTQAPSKVADVRATVMTVY